LESYRTETETAQTALFLSDAHFGTSRDEEERRRIDRFVSFLRGPARGAGALYIVGDLFDFWFEYRQVVPKPHLLVLTELGALVRAGVRVVYIAGNHDYWLDDYFADELGFTVSRRPLDLRAQERRLYVTHGDDLTSGHDPGYRFLRRLVRSPFAIRLYHLIHPDLGVPFARWASGLSRAHTNRKKFVLNRTLEGAAREKLREGFDGVLMGHIHYADHFRYEEGELVLLGDWIDSFTYARLTGGRIALERWEGEGSGG